MGIPLGTRGTRRFALRACNSPFGALVDFMSQPDVRVESMGPKTLPGVFIGYHVNPGGEWSGDYLVADLAYFRAKSGCSKI